MADSFSINPLAHPYAWNLVADNYARAMAPFFQLYADDAIRLAELPPDADVLDVACGPGTLAFRVAPRARRLAAIDFSPEMIARLRAAAASEQAGERIEARVGDGQALDLADASFDAVFCMFGLMFFPDRARGFRELLRVLRPGRRAVIATWRPIERLPILRDIFEELRRRLPDMSIGAGDPPLADPETFEAEMRAAGFCDVAIHELTHEVRLPDADAFWRDFGRSAIPLRLLEQKLGAAAFDPIRAAICAKVQEVTGGGPVVFPMTALLGVGLRDA